MRRREVGVSLVLAMTAAAVCAGLAGIGLPREGTGVRSPYLQLYRQAEGGDEITLCWTTRGMVPSEVRLRTRGGAVTLLGDGIGRRRHTVVVGRLDPDTEYEYQAQSDDPEGSWNRFRTAPAVNASPPTAFSFAAFGDFGSGSEGQRQVVLQLERLQPSFALILGDLAYPAATESALTRLFYRPLAGYGAGHVIWPVWGNHDLAAEGGAPLDRAAAVPENGPPGLAGNRNYSFDYGNAHFAVLDSNLDTELLERHVIPWLDADLAATTRRWKFIFTHHPPLSAGEHGDTMRLQKLLPAVLARHGVTACFSGHDHLYQRFRTNLPLTQGVHYIVSGAGGAHLYRHDASDPRLAFSDGEHFGLALVDVEPTRVRLRFVRATRDGQPEPVDDVILAEDGQ